MHIWQLLLHLSVLLLSVRSCSRLVLSFIHHYQQLVILMPSLRLTLSTSQQSVSDVCCIRRSHLFVKWSVVFWTWRWRSVICGSMVQLLSQGIQVLPYCCMLQSAVLRFSDTFSRLHIWNYFFPVMLSEFSILLHVFAILESNHLRVSAFVVLMFVVVFFIVFVLCSVNVLCADTLLCIVLKQQLTWKLNSRVAFSFCRQWSRKSHHEAHFHIVSLINILP